MWIRVLQIWFVFYSVGCGNNPEDGSRCLAEPDTLDYGKILAPAVSPLTVFVDRSFTIVNVGNEGLYGSFSYAFDNDLSHPPSLELVPPDSIAAFDLSPGDTADFSLRMGVRSDTRPGEYVGSVFFGDHCPDLHLRARIDPSD